MRKCKRSLRRGRLLRRKVFDSREETAYFSLLYLQRFSCSFNRLYCYAMLYCTTLFCSIFYCFLLYEYYSVLYYNTLYSSVLYHTMSCTVIHTVIYAALSILYFTILYCTLPCCAVHFCTERLKQALDHSIPFSVKVNNTGNLTFRGP